MIPRRWRSAGPARPPLFLEIDNRLGALQPLRQPPRWCHPSRPIPHQAWPVPGWEAEGLRPAGPSGARSCRWVADGKAGRAVRWAFATASGRKRFSATPPQTTNPPLTRMHCPVTYTAASDAKNRITEATSSGSPNRPSFTREICSANCAEVITDHLPQTAEILKWVAHMVQLPFAEGPRQRALTLPQSGQAAIRERHHAAWRATHASSRRRWPCHPH